jgi:hypothetical protein
MLRDENQTNTISSTGFIFSILPFLVSFFGEEITYLTRQARKPLSFLEGGINGPSFCLKPGIFPLKTRKIGDRLVSALQGDSARAARRGELSISFPRCAACRGSTTFGLSNFSGAFTILVSGAGKVAPSLLPCFSHLTSF